MCAAYLYVLLSKGQVMLVPRIVIALVLKGCIVKFYIICSQSEWGLGELLIAASVCLSTSAQWIIW